MGLIEGAYDAKVGGFAPGGASLHNCVAGHGPDQASFERASSADLKIGGWVAFGFVAVGAYLFLDAMTAATGGKNLPLGPPVLK